MRQISVQPENLLTHLLAPFYGATHDEVGRPLPSAKTKMWTFTLGNKRKNNHLTFRSVRKAGKTINDPVLIEVMVGSSLWETLGEINTVGGLNLFHGSTMKYCQSSSYLNIERLTLKWLVQVMNKQSYELPEHLELMTSSRCASCGLKLTNPDSLEFAIGPICRNKQNRSKRAK